MRQSTTKQPLRNIARRTPYLAVAGFLFLAPCAFPAGSSAPATATADVSGILNDFRDVTSQGQSSSDAASLRSDSPEKTLPSSLSSRLIDAASHGERQGLRKKVAVPEAHAAFSWLIDLGGLAGLAFCMRRRSQQ